MRGVAGVNDVCGFLVYHGPKKNFPNFEEAFQSLAHRGPDQTEILERPNASLGFHRLAIMDLTENGSQPFHHKTRNWHLVCNGEIYNWKDLRLEYSEYDYQSFSDCEVILPVIEHLGFEDGVRALDGEFAFVLYNEELDRLVAARDPMGIRPLFYAQDKNGKYAFASEAKALTANFSKILPFPPGHYFDGESFFCYCNLAQEKPQLVVEMSEYWDHSKQAATPKLQEVLKPINELLTKAVIKRLKADAPVGLLLSGGLDSSLVCALAARAQGEKKNLHTFAVGMVTDPIDLKYAKQVAEFIGSHHTEVSITEQDVLDHLKDVIRHLETWDITTIRASMGMYLLCKYIKEKTKIKVLLTGEVSDEIFGYKYTDFAPSGDEFQREAQKRVKELYLYDVLRADRCISAHSLEARVPFSDTAFVDYVMKMPGELKRNHYNMGKYLLREAFRNENLLPESILNRDKAAFSDAVGHSLVDTLKAQAESLYSEEDLAAAKKKYPHGTPFTKESLMYRNIFEEFYPGRSNWIPDFWMPNKTWQNCDVQDPSARVLPNYGKSGV